MAKKTKEEHKLNGTEELDWTDRNPRSKNLWDSLMIKLAFIMFKYGFDKRPYRYEKDITNKIIDEFCEIAPLTAKQIGFCFDENTKTFCNVAKYIIGPQTKKYLGGMENSTSGITYRIRGCDRLSANGILFKRGY